MNKAVYLFIAVLLLFFSTKAAACTSVIISGKSTPDGRPVMMKHRDTGELNNRIQWFEGEIYNFVALVNASWEKERQASYPYAAGEAWTGSNSAGFSIMNTATYDLKDDDVPIEMMDREGELMYRALEICSNLADFEMFLDTLSRPMGVEANFGIIDAHGGAAYYEVNNYKWVKFDVNTIDEGYMVVTNFTRTGRVQDRKGVDRFEKASEIMKGLSPSDYNHKGLINSISRSGKPILRNITSASIVIEGVADGGNPLHTVMWTCLGYPTCVPYIPVMVLDKDRVPSYMKKSKVSDHSLLCDGALKEKEIRGISSREEGLPEEAEIDYDFNDIYSRWTSGKMRNRRFFRLYSRFCDDIFGKSPKIN